MGQKVKAAVLEIAEKLALREFELPETGPEDGLLKVEMAGVCTGTDPNLYRGKVVYADLPIIMGHEMIGRIARVGNVASRRWRVKEGDRVIVEGFIRCGYCPKCIAGDYRFCDNQLSYGGGVSASRPPHLWGAYAEYMYLPSGAVVYKVSEKIAPEAGVLVNAVIANAIHWGRLIGDFGIGDAVVVQGVGQQGLALVIAAKESGCNPIIVTGLSVDTQRFALAREFGADYTINVEEENVVQRVREITGGQMADVVVDVAGNPKAIETSIELVRNQGTVVVPAVTGKGVTTPVVFDRLVYRDIRLMGVFSSDCRSMGKAIKLVESGKYPIEKIVTHRFSLEEAEKAVRTAGRYFKDINPVKCVIIP